MLEIKDFWMFGQGRTFEVNVRFGRTEQFGLKMAELFGRTECSFEHYVKSMYTPVFYFATVPIIYVDFRSFDSNDLLLASLVSEVCCPLSYTSMYIMD